MKHKKSFWFYRFSRAMVDYFFRIFYRLKVYGEKTHFIPGRAIIAGNHVSFYDPPMVGVGWQEVIHYFARPSLFDKFVLGFLLRSYNVHPLPANSPTSAIKFISELLNKELKVVIFPEGTRAKEDKIMEPKPGFAMISYRTQSPIIPVYVGGTYKAWSRNRKFPKLFGRCVCVFGSPLHWSAFKHLSKKEAQDAMMQAWKKAVEDLRVWAEAGANGTPP